MSKTIDERIVSMQFDNRHFEKNVQTTMSTLDKLKQRLNFKDSSKSLQDLGAAANKVDMSPLSRGVETVGLKFNGLYTIADQALRNITNRVQQAAENIVKSLTITPVSTGFSEYELKMGSIQTIMASTGETLDTVNGYLNELNKYSDMTIYSFSDMTQNIGKFTNAGVKLEDAVLAIKGISNEAAVSGATANEASRAMYNFAQALSAGYVKLIDWKSIENANMATVEFKNQLIESAVAAGTLKDAGDGMYETLDGKLINATQNFNDSLQDQWMTSEVLIGTLKKYADEETEIGEKATKAATEVKTFTQMMDALKESAQSGWAQTWEILVGDFEEAKSLWTNVNNVISGWLENSANKRNAKLENIFGSKWDKLTEKIKEAGVTTEKFSDTLKETAKDNGFDLDDLIDKYGSLKKVIDKGKVPVDILRKALKKFNLVGDDAVEVTEDITANVKEFQDVVRRVVRGEFGNGETRVKKLTKAGYEYAHVQELVNKCWKNGKLDLSKITEAQLVNMGYTKKQAETLKELSKEADEAGISIDELIETMNKPTGRELLIESFSNIYQTLSTIFSKIGEAWNNVFNDDKGSEKEPILYRMLDGFRNFTESLKISEEHAENFKTVMEGLFSLFKLTGTVASMSLSGSLKILNSVLKLFGTDLGEALAWVADKITQFNNWLEENTMFGWDTAYDDLAAVIVSIYNGIKKCVDEFLKLPVVAKFITKVKDKMVEWFGEAEGFFEFFDKEGIVKKITVIFDKISAAIASLKDSNMFNTMFGIGTDIVTGLALGLKNGAIFIYDTIVNLANTLIEKFCKPVEVNSPSLVFKAIGVFLMLGLALGIKDGSIEVLTTIKTIAMSLIDAVVMIFKNGLPMIIEFVQTFGSKMIETFREADIDLGSLAVFASLIGLGLLIKKVINIFEPLKEGIKGVNGIIKSISEGIKNVTDAKAKKIKSESFLNIAKGITMLALAFALLVKVTQDANVWPAVAAMAGLAIGMIALTAVINKMDIEDLTKVSWFTLGFSAAMLIMAMAIKKLASIESSDRAYEAVGQMIMLIGSITLLTTLYGAFAKTGVTKNIDKVGGMIFKMAIGMVIMATAIKIIAGIPSGNVDSAMNVIVGVYAIFGIFTILSQFSGKHADKAGSMMLKMGLALMTIPITIRMIAGISPSDIDKGLKVILGVSSLFLLVVATSTLAGENASKAGSMMLKMALALLTIPITIRMIAGISQSDIDKGIITIGKVGTLMLAFVVILSFFDTVNTDIISKAGNFMLKFSGAILGISIAMKLLASISQEDINKSIGAIVAIGLIIGGLIAVTQLTAKYAGVEADKMGTMLLKMSLGLLVLAGAIAILSMLDADKMWNATLAISLLGGVFGALIAVTKLAQDCTKTMWSIVAAIGVLSIALVALTILDPDKVMNAAISLTMVIGALAGLLFTTKFSKDSWKGILAITGVIAVLGIALYALASLPVENTLAAAGALSILLLSLSASFLILSAAGPLATEAFKSLGVMLLAVGALAIMLGLMAYFDIAPSLDTALGLSILLLAMSGACWILAAVGPVAASALLGALALDGVILIIGGLIIAIGALMKHFPELQDFLDRGIQVLVDIGHGLGKAIGSIVGGLAEGVTDSLPAIGEDLAKFAENAAPFIDRADEIKTSMSAVASIAKAILDLTKANLVDAIASWITGGSSLATFGTELASLGTSLSQFVTNLGTFDEASVKTIECAAKAINAMTAAASEVDGQADWSKWLFGDNSLATFGDELPGLGTNLSQFVTNLGTFDEATVATVTCAGNAIKALAEAASNINGQPDWAKAIFGDNGLGSFGEEMASVGSSLASFAENIGTFTEDKVTTVNCAVKAIKAITSLSNANLSGAKENLPGLGEVLPDFATDLGSFCENIPSTESLDAAIGAFNKVVEMVNNIAKGSVSNAKDFAKGLKEMGKAGIDSFVTTFTSDSAKTDVEQAAATLVDKAIVGAESKQESLTNAFKTLVNKAKAAIKTTDYYLSFSQVGQYLANGFANGIDSEDSLLKVRTAAKAMAKAAEEAAKKQLEINSPSKVFRRIGEGTGEGFVDGVDSQGSVVYRATQEMASRAKKGFSNTISKIAEAINTDIDAQPTIRPVLDLSDVKSGAGAIGGMLDLTPSVDVLANVRSAGSMMNGRIQNGSDIGIISAIKDLKDSFKNAPSNTYNLNGITYDDGSNISSAVQAIVRAAVVERRK